MLGTEGLKKPVFSAKSYMHFSVCEKSHVKAIMANYLKLILVYHFQSFCLKTQQNPAKSNKFQVDWGWLQIPVGHS